MRDHPYLLFLFNVQKSKLDPEKMAQQKAKNEAMITLGYHLVAQELRNQGKSMPMTRDDLSLYLHRMVDEEFAQNRAVEWNERTIKQYVDNLLKNLRKLRG